MNSTVFENHPKISDFHNIFPTFECYVIARMVVKGVFLSDFQKLFTVTFE